MAELAAEVSRRDLRTHTAAAMIIAPSSRPTMAAWLHVLSQGAALQSRPIRAQETTPPRLRGRVAVGPPLNHCTWLGQRTSDPSLP